MKRRRVKKLKHFLLYLIILTLIGGCRGIIMKQMQCSMAKGVITEKIVNEIETRRINGIEGGINEVKRSAYILIQEAIEAVIYAAIEEVIAVERGRIINLLFGNILSNQKIIDIAIEESINVVDEAARSVVSKRLSDLRKYTTIETTIEDGIDLLTSSVDYLHTAIAIAEAVDAAIAAVKSVASKTTIYQIIHQSLRESISSVRDAAIAEANAAIVATLSGRPISLLQLRRAISNVTQGAVYGSVTIEPKIGAVVGTAIDTAVVIVDKSVQEAIMQHRMQFDIFNIFK